MNARTIAGLVLLALCVQAVPVAAQTQSLPPEPKIPESALQAGVISNYRSDIDEYVLALVKQLVLADADAEEQVITSRDALIRGYEKYASSAYRRTYAEAASELLAKALEVQGPVKQINLALALRAMPEVTVQPALNVAVAHKNPGVRYIGWVAYNELKGKILAQGTSATEKMLSSIAQRLGQETNPVLLSRIYVTSRLQRSGPEILDHVLLRARKEIVDILQQAWSQQCRQVAAGDPQMIESATHGVRAWQTAAIDAAESDQGKQTVAQALADAMQAGVIAYRNAQSDSPARSAAATLLATAENALQDVAEANSNRLQQALEDRDLNAANRAEAVELAVLDWISELEPLGVEEREITPPQTQPAEQTQAAE